MAQITSIGQRNRELSETVRTIMLAVAITAAVVLSGAVASALGRSFEAATSGSTGSYTDLMVNARQAEIASDDPRTSDGTDGLASARLAELGRSNSGFDDSLANARLAELGRFSSNSWFDDALASARRAEHGR